MKIIIRKPRLEPQVNGIPKDFADVINYFNHSLENDYLPWIPRKTPITDDEIKELWIPSLDININLVAELEEKVVGQATVFYDTKSTAYKYAAERVQGDIGFTAKLGVYVMVVEAIILKLAKVLRKEKKGAIWNIAEESPANKIMRELGYDFTQLSNVDRYKNARLSGRVQQYNLP